MSVYLGRADARVPQQLLDGAQVSSVLQQVRREGVAQGVGRQPPRKAGALRCLLNDQPASLARQPSAVAIEEEGLLGRPLHQTGPAVAEIDFQPLGRHAAERQQALLAALAPDPYFRFREVEVADVE